MKPEQEARLEIDKLLCEAGFRILNIQEFKPDLAKAHYAVREFVLKNGTRADYVLFVAGRACAVIEAKKPNALSGAENQALSYAQNLAKELGAITFLYQSNANELFFTNLKEPKPKARKIFAFHSPEELQAKLDDASSLRARISQLPLLESARLRDCQKDAIVGLEKSLQSNKQRALVYMATGAGKTMIRLILSSSMNATAAFMGNGDKCSNILTRNIGNQNPHELINGFRNSKQFRIAVTVDMIATGTDIKPLEVLIFMRDIKSASYYAQMVGRGVRSIHREDLRAVTPNADSKTHFYVIDAVGVSESQKLDSRPLERKKSLNFKEILNCIRESVEKGDYEKDVLLSFASRLSRLELKLGDDDNASLKDSSGKSLCALAGEILEFADSECSEHSLFQSAPSPCQTEISSCQAEDSLCHAEPPCQAETPLSDSKSPICDSVPSSCHSKPPFCHSEPLPCHSESPICHSEPLGEESQKEESHNKESPTNPLEIFRDESFCNQLLAMARKSKIYIDETSQDCVLHTGFDTQNAQNLINRFLDFILRNKDEIEALSIIYARDYKNRHLTYRVISELATKLKRDSMDIPSLWNAFALRDKDRVSRNPSKNLTNLISLVRCALHHDDRLQDFAIVSISRYNLWIGRCMQKGMRFSPEQEAFLELIRDYIIANGIAEIADIQEICESLGGLYRAKALFKESLETLIDELGMALVG
ncbi:MAG: DEAD/DEAH box helicase family protein [Helicobacter sp.]|nr:DEAD/DEAH box helicase family protein [Helicobacter sp.]